MGRLKAVMVCGPDFGGRLAMSGKEAGTPVQAS